MTYFFNSNYHLGGKISSDYRYTSRYEPYLSRTSPAPGASVEAAIAGRRTRHAGPFAPGVESEL
jgi:hypothetical protein